MTKNGIHLDLIEVIQVYLKIYDLWMNAWVGG